MENPAKIHSAHILIVDDDPIALKLLKVSLEKQGFHATTASDVKSAIEILDNPTASSKIECVLTDFRMPEKSGLDMITWIKANHPAIASILFTAEGEKKLVENSMRIGAFSYMEKPLDMQKLTQTIKNAVDTTRARRHLENTEKAAIEAGEIQRRMQSQHVDPAAKKQSRIKISFHPMHQAGGDFASTYTHMDNAITLVVADVSGHNLDSAFVSAYFQGMARGMLEKGSNINNVFQTANHIIASEWCSVADARTPSSRTVSISACGIYAAPHKKEISIINTGAPPVIYVDHGGNSIMIKSDSSPLGWFSEYSWDTYMITGTTGMIYCWTDGLDDLAFDKKVDPCSMAFALLNENSSAVTEKILANAKDDIMAAYLNSSDENDTSPLFHPIFFQTYTGNSEQKIDSYQNLWEASIRMAIPAINENSLFDILLASREATLNAIKHGCCENPDKKCSIQANYRPADGTMRIKVEDDGTGHSFDANKYENSSTDDFIPDDHRGLIFIKHLAKETLRERNGSTLIMEFATNPGRTA